MRESTDWLCSYTGAKIWPLDMRPGEIFIEDIAHSLSRQCRFNGHCGPFYSVAEHSVHVSNVVPAECALWGLLHDAAETFLSDIVRPLKRRCYYFIGVGSMERYQDAEERILRAIAERFGLPGLMPKEVLDADERMLATERQQLFDGRQPVWDCIAGIEPYRIAIPAWDCYFAEERFLSRFRKLTHG